jgi:hypothetical protein
MTTDAAYDTSCESCGKGRYQVQEGQALCLPCTPGKYMDHTGEDDKCEECAVNFVSLGAGAEVCLACDAGADTATLVTVPSPPLAPVVEIVMLPVVPLSVTPVPAIKRATPVFVIVTVPVVALAVTPIPSPGVNVVKLLALANSVSKFTLVLVNAVYSESLPTDSFGSPTLIDCFPVIAILV